MVYSTVISTMEKNDAGRRHNSTREGSFFKGRSGIGSFRRWLLRKDLKEVRELSKNIRRGKTVPSKQNGKCKGLEARMFLACSRRSVWLEWSKWGETDSRWEQRSKGCQSRRALQAIVRTLALALSVMGTFGRFLEEKQYTLTYFKIFTHLNVKFWVVAMQMKVEDKDRGDGMNWRLLQ